MDLSTTLSISFFLLACVLAIYQSWKESWEANQKIGTVLLLIGVAVGLFFDDFIAEGSNISPWIEPIGALIIVVGLLVTWLWQID